MIRRTSDPLSALDAAHAKKSARAKLPETPSVPSPPGLSGAVKRSAVEVVEDIQDIVGGSTSSRVAEEVLHRFEDLYSEVESRLRDGLGFSRLDAVIDLATTLQDVSNRLPKEGDTKAYENSVKAALAGVEDAGWLFLTSPKRGLAKLVDATRALFETLQLDKVADGLEEAAMIAGEQTPAAVDSFAAALAEFAASLPPELAAQLAPLQDKVGRLQETLGTEVKELTDRLSVLAQRLRELDQEGRATNDPDDLARILIESKEVAIELAKTMNSLESTLEALRPQLQEIRDDLAVGAFAGQEDVEELVARLDAIDGQLAGIEKTIAEVKPFVIVAREALKDAAPHVRLAVDLAENHARAADSPIRRFVGGVDLWNQGKYIPAAGEFVKGSTLVPLALVSWGLGAGGVAATHLGFALSGQGPLLLPLAWAAFSLGKGLDAAAGGLAWVNDRLVAPLSDAVVGFGVQVAEGIASAVETGAEVAQDAAETVSNAANDVVDAAKDAAEKAAKAAKKAAEKAADAAKDLFNSIF